MKRSLSLLIISGCTLMALQIGVNIRLQHADPVAITETVSPAQIIALRSELEAKGLALYPALYWNEVK
ncbi:MAG: hypothetical protein HQL20_02575 [Candidatus Omnitrophica bacterium]|nr:hypothetical protein [Candidatus Omnitrophota bacterium]